MRRVDQFLLKYYPSIDRSNENISAFLLLIFASKKKSMLVQNTISLSKIDVYTNVFGNNNSKTLRQQFYSDPLIRQLWHLISHKMTK